ncbi:alpha,alpha-trehalase [Candidatus Woesearchaeota archaeon]|nr:alpha,alpha-trehalase [Candidatus Woesearchaeota archaeon]
MQSKNRIEKIITAKQKLKPLNSFSLKIQELPHNFIPASSDILIRKDGEENKYPKDKILSFKTQFYWDSMFIIKGLEQENDLKTIKNMIENFFFMFEQLGFIPNSFNRNDTRSQPPLLTEMILTYYNLSNDKKWLKKAYDTTKKEYEYWTTKHHLTITNLSRYYDLTHYNGESEDAENESGWDLTPRFENKAHIVCPIDLNCFLNKYEKDLSKISKILGLKKEINWEEKSKKRIELINKYLWDEKNGLFFDYCFESNKKLKTKTLASFVPLWTKTASQHQAKKLVSNLKLFEHEFGLSTTDQNYGAKSKQWNYPNGWAPLHYLVIKGLLNYGFIDDAKRIATKWLYLCSENFLQKNYFEEKYSIVKNKKKIDDPRYSHQKNLHWTQAVFLALYDLVITT